MMPFSDIFRKPVMRRLKRLKWMSIATDDIATYVTSTIPAFHSDVLAPKPPILSTLVGFN